MRLSMLMALAVMGLLAAAPPKPAPKQLKSPPPPDGAVVFRAYCAACHGDDGKGAGPVAESLHMRPSDLTGLKQRNGGEFPAYRVRRMLDASDNPPAHGARRMPVWGPDLTPANATAILEHLKSKQE